MSVEVLLAKEDDAIFYCIDTKYLIRVLNMPDPDKVPKGGLLERSKIYGIKSENSPDFDILKGYKEWPEIANIYQELDTVHNDDVEYHLILDEDEELVNTIDTINMDSFHSIGNYQYHTEFNKIFYKNR
jgi:hypothetical protein